MKRHQVCFVLSASQASKIDRGGSREKRCQIRHQSRIRFISIRVWRHLGLSTTPSVITCCPLLFQQHSDIARGHSENSSKRLFVTAKILKRTPLLFSFVRHSHHESATPILHPPIPVHPEHRRFVWLLQTRSIEGLLLFVPLAIVYVLQEIEVLLTKSISPVSLSTPLPIRKVPSIAISLLHPFQSFHFLLLFAS
jgi:hypothetical protein